MAAVNFSGTSQIVFTATASMEPSLHRVLGVLGNWRLDEVAGGGFVLNRKVTGTFQAIAGGTVTNADLKDL